jgi:hypothetical protein
MHHHRDAAGGGGFPYFFPGYESDWPETVSQEQEREKETNPAPLVRVLEASPTRDAERAMPAQVIEIPKASKIVSPKSLPPTVFVLVSGEKLETQRYLLTATSLSATVARSQKTIPLELLDIDATVAANRNRGIDLRIPNDRNEISIRF